MISTHLDERLVVAHFFLPSTGANWYLVEYDPADTIGFAFADLGSAPDAEWGYVSLTGLETLRHHGMVVERDLSWIPQPVRQALPSAAWDAA